MSAPSEAEAAMAAALFRPQAPAPGGRRFDVHRNNVVAGLIAALERAYPAVRALVGETFFRAAAREFVRAHPPRSPVMLLWGEAFPAWIEAFPPAASVPYLGDVARIERAWIEAYHAEEATPLARDALLGVPPRRLAEARLALHPSLRLVASPWPAASLWAEASGRAPRSRLDLARGETALVARPEDRVTVRLVSPATAALIAALSVKAGLGAAAAAAAEAAGEAGFRLGDEIADLFDHGLVVHVHGRIA